MAWALASLAAQLDPPFLDALLAAAQRLMPDFSGPQLASLSWALAVFGSGSGTRHGSRAGSGTRLGAVSASLLATAASSYGAAAAEYSDEALCQVRLRRPQVHVLAGFEVRNIDV